MAIVQAFCQFTTPASYVANEIRNFNGEGISQVQIVDNLPKRGIVVRVTFTTPFLNPRRYIAMAQFIEGGDVRHTLNYINYPQNRAGLIRNKEADYVELFIPRENDLATAQNIALFVAGLS